MSAPKITFIGAGSTVFVKNILGDVFQRPALKSAHIALMDIDETRLEESHIVVRKLMDSVGANGEISCHRDRKTALQGADFVVVAFQIGGYEPCTVTDFAVCKRHGLEQTIADTLGPGGIMRALRTIPHLWAICDEINHMAFYLSLEKKLADGSYVSIYPDLLQAYADGRAPKPNLHGNPRCENIVRYEMFKKLGYFVTESSEHFAEYTPWFIKPGRDDLIARYKVPLDEYPKRCVEQLANWHQELESYKRGERIEVKPSREYASTIMNAIWTGEPSVVYGNVRNDNLIDNLPQGCCVEVACLVDANGIQPTKVGALPAHLAALMQTNINVQTLLTQAILTENRDYVYYATMMDPHTAAVLGIEEIYALVDDLIASHGDWLPAWLHR